MRSTPHEDFAQRLQQVLDYSGFPKGRARTGALALRYNVSRETARKWLTGLTLPELTRIISIAEQQNVSLEWLATGRGTLQGEALSVREEPGKYGDPDELHLIGLVRRLTRKKRRALLELLDAH